MLSDQDRISAYLPILMLQKVISQPTTRFTLHTLYTLIYLYLKHLPA